MFAAYLNGHPLASSVQIAVDFTNGSIMRTKQAGTDPRYGVNFEAGIPEFIRSLESGV